MCNQSYSEDTAVSVLSLHFIDFFFFVFLDLERHRPSSFFVLIKHSFLLPLNFGWNALWRSRLYKRANAEWLPNRCSVSVPFLIETLKATFCSPSSYVIATSGCRVDCCTANAITPPPPLQQDCTCTVKSALQPWLGPIQLKVGVVWFAQRWLE